MLKREKWQHLLRKLNWTADQVEKNNLFPPAMSGESTVPTAAWQAWDEAYRINYHEYIQTQYKKVNSVNAVQEVLGQLKNIKKIDPTWLNGIKLYSAVFTLAEYAAVIGNLRAARFGQDSAWRNLSLFGALDELRHAQIPLKIMHDFIRWDPQFDWTHKFYHSNNWIAIAGRHFIDELLLLSDPIEFAIATNFVFETGFTNLQFVGLTAIAELVGDNLFAKMLQSIQTDEMRHAQIGPAVIEILIQHDKAKVQRLVDKWFWRSWQLFAIVTGLSIDYFTPVNKRQYSFKEFMQEWITDQFLNTLKQYQLEKPWYWDFFLQSIDHYHHMVAVSAYTYRASTWFNWHVPSPEDRQWYAKKYPNAWPGIDKIWQQIIHSWQETPPGVEWSVHGTTPIGFCNLCQLVLCHGTPAQNAAIVKKINDHNYIFCSEPCLKIYEAEPERYQDHKDVVHRILCGEAPGNVVALVENYFGLMASERGRDLHLGQYSWMEKRK
jgi:toluene monooxygenase system protein A